MKPMRQQSNPARKRRLFDYIEQRDLEMRSVYRRLVLSGEVGDACDSMYVWELVVRHPASRFFVSEESATRALRAYAAGRSRGCGKAVQSVVGSLGEAFLARRAVDPSLSAARFAAEAVYGPAPGFFIKADTARKSVAATCRRLGLRI